MAVDFLDIAPAEDVTALHTVRTRDGAEHEVEIHALDMSQMARIAQRFPLMRKALFGSDVPADVRGAALAEAWPAIVAAGLGHLGEAKYENAARRFGSIEVAKLGAAVLALGNPQPEEEDDSPLPDAAAVITDAVAETISPPAPSNI